MKEIKVRCWDGEKMIYPEYLNLYKQTAHWTENSIPAQSNIFMLYTGLKDKNGEEIYEGDLLRLHKPWYSGGICPIEYREPLASFVIAMPGAVQLNWEHQKYYEVVGNIYQNPDLLK